MFHIPSFSSSGGEIPSDSLQLFTISPGTGSIAFSQLSPSGGMIPRQFSLNRAGDLAAVGLQQDGRVVMVHRDLANHRFDKGFVANVEDLATGVSCIVWDECEG